jgi:hypothetical protein
MKSSADVLEWVLPLLLTITYYPKRILILDNFTWKDQETNTRFTVGLFFLE